MKTVHYRLYEGERLLATDAHIITGPNGAHFDRDKAFMLEWTLNGQESLDFCHEFFVGLADGPRLPLCLVSYDWNSATPSVAAGHFRVIGEPR